MKYVAAACAGELLSGSGETIIRRVGADSRQVQPGDLFVALAGDRFDGHDFFQEVRARGASAVMADRLKAPGSLGECAVVGVENTRRALGDLAAAYRTQFRIPVIAVAGSNGKTTTKELLASVLREKFNTLASEASFNNDVGVPLTLLKMEHTHALAVLEVGTNHPGELAPLVKMIQPRYGIITSIGREHLEFFGDVAGVAEEEGRLAELLPDEGKLFVNGDCPELLDVSRQTRAEVVRVGFGERCQWRARDVWMDETGVAFEVEASDSNWSGQYRLKLLGRHQVINALLAIAAGKELGMSAGQVRAGLAKCQPPIMRLQLWKIGSIQVLDDSYNANADSMRAALETLRDFPCRGRRVAVLGDMAELGQHAPAAHAEVGRYAAASGVERLFAVGKEARLTAEAARQAGLRAVDEFATVEAAARAIGSFIGPGDVVLLKASRAARLERLAEMLRNGASESQE